MPSTMLAIKRFSGLRAADADGQAVMANIAEGETVRLEITRPNRRSLKMHNLFFALLSVAAEHMEWTTDQALIWVKVATGHCSVVHDRNGEVTFIPKSVSFAKMDQAAFTEFFGHAVDVIMDRLMPPGTLTGDLVEEVFSRAGTRMPA